MAKKRKLRSSETESSNRASEPEQPQLEEQPQIKQEGIELEEQPQIKQEQIEEQDQQNNEEQQEQPHHMDEEEDEEEDDEQEGQEGDGGEAVNTSNDIEQAPSEANGGENAGDGEDEYHEEEELDGEPVEKLLEPFGKEHLLVLLKEAVSKYPEFMESVQKLADADPAHRKIFVHGLGWDTNAETLISVFGKYGEIEDCKAVTDKVSGKSKGYGFILFKHWSGARKALKQPQKQIGTRMTSCQLASAGPGPTPLPTVPPVSEYTQRKIFVSNVSAEIDPQKLLEFFSKYGEIEDGPLGLDKQTGKPKGFALFVYKTIDSAKKALEEPHKNFEGHTLHCQKAVDGAKPNKPYYQPPQQQQQYHHHSSRKEKARYSSGVGSGTGHLMAPSGPAVYPAVAAPALNPALGQALTALLATQGAGLGISNLLGGLGAPVNQGMPPVMNNAGYGNQGGGGYGNQPGMQGNYQHPQMGQGGAGRSQQGGAPYMGHGH